MQNFRWIFISNSPSSKRVRVLYIGIQFNNIHLYSFDVKYATSTSRGSSLYDTCQVLFELLMCYLLSLVLLKLQAYSCLPQIHACYWYLRNYVLGHSRFCRGTCSISFLKTYVHILLKNFAPILKTSKFYYLWFFPRY